MVLGRGLPPFQAVEGIAKVRWIMEVIKKVQINAQNAPKYVWRPGSALWRSLSAPSPDLLAAIEVVLLVLSFTLESVHHYIDSKH